METRHAALGALGASPLLVVPRRSWRQRLLWPLLFLVGVVALAASGWGGQQAAALSIEVVGRPIAQKIVDHAEVEIHEVRLAPASWEGLQARAGMLAVDCSIDMSVDVIYTAVRSTLGSADLHIEHDGRHVGVLSARASPGLRHPDAHTRTESAARPAHRPCRSTSAAAAACGWRWRARWWWRTRRRSGTSCRPSRMATASPSRRRPTQPPSTEER